MRIIYNIAIELYYFLVRIFSYFNVKAKKLLVGQKETKTFNFQLPNKKIIWFHCASVGEFEQGYPLLNKIRNQLTDCIFLITFFSPSGYEFVQKKYPEEWIMYLPKDTQKEMRSFVAKINPSLVFIVKYEFWYHLINELKIKTIPTFLVSGIFRENQLFFKPFYGSFFAKTLKKFNHLFIQDEASFNLLDSINIQQKTIVGDTRFDRVIENKKMTFLDEKIEKFILNHKVFIAGSCWSHDEEVLTTIIENLPTNWKVILVPHEISSYKTDFINSKVQKYSTLNDFNSKVLIIDEMGMLSKLYRFSELTYIGGGFGKGIHNLLEAAVYGMPILIGPNYQKFNEAKTLVSLGCVFKVNNKIETENLVIELINSDYKIEKIKTILKKYIAENTNVSDKILVYLTDNGYLKNN